MTAINIGEFLHTDVDIDFNGTRYVTEGSVLDICVPFSDQRERDVIISFTFTPTSLTSGMFK